MAFDIIVFNQQGLIKAINDGYKSIALCDGSFFLTEAENIEYTAIGKVEAATPLTENEFYGKNTVCIGFTPKFSKNKKKNNEVLKWTSIGKSMSSYASSYFMTSYRMMYSSFNASSYKAESYYISSGSSFLSSFVTSFAMNGEEEYIFVNGYGINLI